MAHWSRSAPLRISAAYAAVGMGYILLSDWLVESADWWAWSPGLHTLKGVGFILVTALLLYALLRREFSRRERAERIALRAQRMEALGQLTVGIAHDFNNMLTIVFGNLDLLERQIGKAESPAQARLRAAKAGAMRCAGITRRLLTFARRQILEEVTIDLNSLLRELDELLRRTLSEASEIEFHLAAQLEPIHVDPSELENAILNLAVNARDAMPHGGKLVIETGAEELDARLSKGRWIVEPGRYVYVAVTDTGIGMSREVQERLFEPLFTTKPQGKGTGLGLSIVLGFVKQSDGHVVVYSEEGHGTTVTLYFPAADTDRRRPSPRRSRAAAEAPTGTETVLVVENDNEVLSLACGILGDLGYQVVETRNATEAMAMARASSIDLLFTDVVMPGRMNGLDLARALSAERPGLKVLVTSGYAQEAIRSRTGETHDLPWLPKPYDRLRLARKVREVLDG